MYKDGIKERLFDTLGWKDREWSKQLGIATYSILYLFAEAQLQAGKSFILESNFKPESDTATFLALQERLPFEPLQIMCRTEGDVLLERYQERWQSGTRHPGHVENDTIADLEPTLLKGYHESMPIGGTVLEVDTTDFKKIDYATLLAMLNQRLVGRA